MKRKLNPKKDMANLYAMLGYTPPRAKSIKPMKPPTVAQQRQRLKFRSASALSAKMNEAAKIGYHLIAKRKFKTPGNCLTSDIMKCISIDDDQKLITKYEDILVSDGPRCPLCNPQLNILSNGHVSMNWLNSIPLPCKDSEDDLVYLLIYSETYNCVLYSDYIGQQKDGFAEFEIGSIHAHEKLHCWNFLKAPKGYEVSPGVYINNITYTRLKP